MKTPAFGFALTATLFAALAPVYSQTPALLNYQGRVAVDSVNFDGAGSFKFALVNPTGDTTFWSNDGTSTIGDEPTNAVSLTVTNGLYSVLLGDTEIANMTAIDPAAFANPDVRLRVWFDDGVNASQLLTPDQRIAPAPYLADGAVTGAAIAPGSIGGAQIAAGSLDYSHLTTPAAPGPGQVLGFDGANLNWVEPGGGSSVWTLNGSSAYYNGGKVGIGTSAPAHALSIGGDLPTWTSFSWGGALELKNASAIGWQTNTAGRRFGIGQTNGGLYVFHTASDPGTTGSPPTYIMSITDAGKVGIGTTAPGGKLTVDTPASPFSGYGIEHTAGSVRLTTFIDGFSAMIGTRSAHELSFFTNDGLPSLTIGTGGAVSMTGGGPGIFTVGSPNGETGLSIQRGGNRGDVRFNGSTIKLVAGPGAGPPGSTSGIAVNTAGNVGIGTETPQAKLHVIGTIRTSVLTITGGADLAEPFPMSHSGIAPGTVVSIDVENPGKLRASARAYDRKVAGIVSGANGIKPGISMIDEAQLEPGENVALSGRVYVRANASAGQISPGVLLTTSDIPGDAMKAADHARAPGSILGKAMTPLDGKTGTVLVLVTLQ